MAKVLGSFAMAEQLRTSDRRAWQRNRLNATPRKCLGGKAPIEMFRAKMLEKRT